MAVVMAGPKTMEKDTTGVHATAIRLSQP